MDRIRVSQTVRAFACNQNGRESTERANRESTSRRFCFRVGGCVHPMTRNSLPFSRDQTNLSLFLFPFVSSVSVLLLLRRDVHRYSRESWLHAPHLSYLLISLKPRWCPPTRPVSRTWQSPFDIRSIALLPFPHFVRNS